MLENLETWIFQNLQGKGFIFCFRNFRNFDWIICKDEIWFWQKGSNPTYLRENIKKFLQNCLENVLDIVSKFSRKIMKISRNTSDTFEKYFRKFRKIISRNSSEIFDKNFRKFRKLGWKISKIDSKNFEKYFGHFWKVFRKISRIISENFDN